MAILKSARMGHPILSRIAVPVKDPTAPEIKRLVAEAQLAWLRRRGAM